jgi:hypothetical protein
MKRGPKTNYTVDMHAYQSAYGLQRRAKARALGLCIQCCADKPREGKAKCEYCATGRLTDDKIEDLRHG